MSEERDLEKELKEARDQYEAENQEIYDEVTKGNEEIRRFISTALTLRAYMVDGELL